MFGCCGHDCSRCVTYLATIKNDDALRKQSQQFYKTMFGLDIPIGEVNCLGCRSDKVFRLCKSCPFTKCVSERKIAECSECVEYPCKALTEYQEKYVNKCNQVTCDCGDNDGSYDIIAEGGTFSCCIGDDGEEQYKYDHADYCGDTPWSEFIETYIIT